jgi:hypothetical protein
VSNGRCGVFGLLPVLFHSTKTTLERTSSLRFRQFTVRSYAAASDLTNSWLRKLEFLARLKEGQTETPPSLREEYIQVIESKGHEDTVRAYEARQREQEEAQRRKEAITQLKEKYRAFSEQFELITQDGERLPAIFNTADGSLDIHFPFTAKDINTGFVDALRSDLARHFEAAEIQTLPGNFLAYRLAMPENTAARVERIAEDAPFTLRAAGFNRIIPYIIR